MAGYVNRTVTLNFPELSEEGDDVHVVIKNPRILPLAELEPEDVATGADGQPDPKKAIVAMNAMLANLVKAWHVWDATVTSDADEDQKLLPLPATAASVAKLPWEIQKALMDQVTSVVNPQ